jgi:cysteine desulfuration protein SufE
MSTPLFFREKNPPFLYTFFRMKSTFDEKVANLKEKFSLLKTAESRYEALMQMGRDLSPFPPEWKIPKNEVQGCQSVLHLKATSAEGLIFFAATSDALISAGLAALLLSIYNEETPETVLLRPPSFLEELGIYASLSPNRSNGLSSIHLKMKQEALEILRISVHKNLN